MLRLPSSPYNLAIGRMSKKRQVHHMWTGSEVKEVMRLWHDNDVSGIAEKLGLSNAQVIYIAGRIRRVYPGSLPMKHRRGYLDNLIKEVYKGSRK